MNEITKVPLVSIIVATYNGEKFLEQQLDSLFSQTYPNVEIIAVDDGSTDNTIDILHHYAYRHTNLRVFLNEKNLGFVKNFEKGCQLSAGDFLAFCDQDDYWYADKIEKMVNAIGGYPMVYCDSILCDENLQILDTKISDRVIGMPITNCLQQAIFGRIYGHAILFTKALYEQAYFFLEVITHDWWVSYVATLHGGIHYLPESLVLYRQHTSNIYGAIGGKSRKQKNNAGKVEKRKKELEKARIRIQTFYTLCPDSFTQERKVLKALVESYRNFSLPNNFRRMFIFFRYHKLLLAVKKRSLLRKYLFCLKMFVMIK